MSRYKLVIAEKPSVAQAIAKALGVTERKDGYLQGGGYIISWCVGHLVGLADAAAYDEKYSRWRQEDLPILPEQWKLITGADKAKQFKILKTLMHDKDVASLVCATDAGREGELIFRFVYEQAGCTKRRAYDYMCLHPRERGTAEYLRGEYGAEGRGLTVTKDGAEDVTVPWPKVQRRIAQLIDWQEFLPPVAAPQQEAEHHPEQQYQDDTISQPETQPLDIAVPTGRLPVFFVDWETAKADFDLGQYEDGDIIGYNKDGVKFALGRSGSLTYVTSTGAFWGSNDVPGHIYEQINAYLDGKLTDEQVRENYLKVISPETLAQEAPAMPSPDAELIGQIRTELDGRGFAVSDELIDEGIEDYNAHGGRGDFQDISDFIENEYLSEYELDYSYINDRLIVYNVKDYDPDELPQIVARVEPDGSIVTTRRGLPP